ncbi:hypothetical protein JOC48_002658 [Aquibacillus albus]|uniref:Uncharacterized protein n=1 Tax=Aquibacillus albus TaxID=1168171 RepID=A0ABS2N203_9BACI|nr:hypothetical protein [Aquibacillus albus]
MDSIVQVHLYSGRLKKYIDVIYIGPLLLYLCYRSCDK